MRSKAIYIKRHLQRLQNDFFHSFLRTRHPSKLAPLNRDEIRRRVCIFSSITTGTIIFCLTPTTRGITPLAFETWNYYDGFTHTTPEPSLFWFFVLEFCLAIEACYESLTIEAGFSCLTNEACHECLTIKACYTCLTIEAYCTTHTHRHHDHHRGLWYEEHTIYRSIRRPSTSGTLFNHKYKYLLWRGKHITNWILSDTYLNLVLAFVTIFGTGLLDATSKMATTTPQLTALTAEKPTSTDSV